MRKRVVIVSLVTLYASHAISREAGLQAPPAGVECFHEIATQYNTQMPELWNGLSRKNACLRIT